SRSLTQECTSPWRFSSGIDSSFSSRSYTLWFSHAVSSMVMKVSISATLFIEQPSLDDDVALARHALPFLVIGAHVGGEFRLPHVDHVSAHPAVALAHRSVGQRFAKRGTQFVYYPGWGAGRDKNSSKRARLITFDAELIQSRHIREQRGALERRDSQYLDASFLDVADRGGELVHHRFDLAAQQVGKRRAAAFVRHMQHFQICLPHEKLDREVIGGAVAG